MSTRRQTRRQKRVGRLSGDADISSHLMFESHDDSQNDTEQTVNDQSVEVTHESRVNTPAPKRAANEMGDVEFSASKRVASRQNTPSRAATSAANETPAPPVRSNSPTKYPMNDNNLVRWEAVAEKLIMAGPRVADNVPSTSTSSNSETSTETNKAAEISTDDLCDEMLRRLSALNKRSESEKRQAAKERGALAMTTICDLMAALRHDKKAQQYLNDVSSGRINDEQAETSTSANQAQKSTSQTACRVLDPSQLILGSISPTNVSLRRNLSQVSSNTTKTMTQSSEASDEKSLEQNNLEEGERGRKRKRSNTPPVMLRLPRQPESGVSRRDREHNDRVVKQLAAEVEEIEQSRRRRRSSSGETRRHHRRNDSNEGDDKIVIPKFDGKDWPAFKSVFESVAAHKKWKPSFKALQLKCSITGAARAALNVIDSTDWSYEKLVDHLELRHGRSRTKIELMGDLDKLARKPTQSLTSWRDEVINVANCGKVTEKQYRELTHYTFLRGLGTFPQMQNWVSERDTEETLNSCYEIATRYEREVGTPAVIATRPVRVATVTAPESTSTSEIESVGVNALVENVPTAASGSMNPTLEKMIKTNQETTDLIEKLQKELEQVKKRNNFKWRGGRGGRGRGRSSFAFGQKYSRNEYKPTQKELDRTGGAPNQPKGAAAPDKSE